jgi:hypothetical protein
LFIILYPVAPLSENDLPCRISLYSIDGNELLHLDTSSLYEEISVESFKPGIYILHIFTSESSLQERIIKIK